MGEKGEMTRRDFLKKSAMVVAGTAVAGVAAGCEKGRRFDSIELTKKINGEDVVYTLSRGDEVAFSGRGRYGPYESLGSRYAPYGEFSGQGKITGIRLVPNKEEDEAWIERYWVRVTNNDPNVRERDSWHYATSVRPVNLEDNK